MQQIYAEDSKILENRFVMENKRRLKRQWVGKYPPPGSLAKINTILLRNATFYGRNLLL